MNNLSWRNPYAHGVLALLFLIALISYAWTKEDAAHTPASNEPVSVLAQPNPIDSLQPGHWYEVPNSKIRNVAPSPLPPGIEGLAGVIKNWNGGGYDTLRDRYIVWGGGHQAYGGNELYAFSINSLTWSRVWGPSPVSIIPPPDNVACAENYSDGNPSSRHNYDGQVYIPPPIDKWWFAGGSLYCGGGNSARDAWWFDFNTLSWSRRANPPISTFADLELMSAYDPVTGHVFFSFPQPGNPLSEYNPSTNTWAQRGEGGGYGHKSMAIDYVGRKIWVIGNGAVHTYTITPSGNMPKVAVTVTGDTSIINGRPGVEYDPVSNRIVMWNGGADVYTLNPGTNVITRVAPASTNTVIPSAPASGGTYGRWAYVPSKNVFLIVNDVDQNVFVYKLAAGGGSPSDTTPPTVSVSAPAAGASVSNAITLSANASDNVGVAGVQFRIDGANTGTEDTTSPYSITWNSASVANGSHTITAVARDMAGNLTISAGIAVSVSNIPDTTPPTVSITAPASGTTVTGTTTIFANASDNTAVAGVQFLLNGVNIGTEDTTSPYSISWDSTAHINGTYTISARARDGAGLTATATGVTVSINNPVGAPQTVTIPIATGNDDVYESWNGSFSLSAPEGYFGAWNGGSEQSGFRFASVQVPKNATITNATLRVVGITDDDTGTVTAQIMARAADNGPAWDVSANRPSQAPYTSASVSWSTTAWAGGTTYTSPNIASVIQELVNRAGWVQGNAIDLMILNNGTTGNADRGFLEFEGGGTPPTLVITFTPPGGGTPDTIAPSTPTGLTATPVSPSQINLAWNASTDNVGVVGYHIYRNNVFLQDVTGTTFQNTGLTANTTYSYAISAFDAAGNGSTATAGVSATTLAGTPTDAIAPTVSVTAPTGGSTLTGSATLSASASDNVGVVGVQFRVDGANAGAEDTTSPYGISWVSSLVPNGTHTITALARDAAGNQTISAGVSVTVSNTGTPLPTSTIGGYPMPTLADETAAYAKWGEVCNDAVVNCYEPKDFPIATPSPIIDPVTSLHNDTEADDLWTYLMQYIRTGDATYLTWAQAWRNYWVNLSIPGSAAWAEDAGYGYDHVNCTGLVLQYEYNGDAAALAKAEQIAGVLNTFYASAVPGSYPISGDNGMRGFGRHLQCITRLAERSTNPQWVALRDKLISLLVQAPNWNETIPTAGGMYFMNQFQTDTGRLPAGSYSQGGRIQSPFHIGLLAEGMWHAYRVTGNATIRDRLIKMAQYVDAYGLSNAYDYSGNTYGISPQCGKWHNYSGCNGTSEGSAGFWDPYYSISQTNILAMAYKLTGNPYWYDRAHHVWLRGTKATYVGGSLPSRIANNQINHYMDTRTDSAAGHRYLSYNKGELQYTYLLFEGGGRVLGSVPLDGTPPTVSITAPVSGAVVVGTGVTLSANASDNVGVVGVQFRVNGGNVGAEDTVSPYGITWNSTTVGNGSHIVTALARDAAGNQTISGGVTVSVNNTIAPAPDTTAPTTPTGLTATPVSSSQINLSWNASTDPVVAGQVTSGVAGYHIYRCAGAGCTLTPLIDIATPSLQNTGLTANTTYSYAIAAFDNANNGSNATPSVNATTQAPPDTQAPTVALSAPAAGASVQGTTVVVSATASDNVGVAGVQFLLDGISLGAEDTTSPYSTTWNTTTAANGTHTLAARARDATGNLTTSASRTVTVANPVSDTQPPSTPTGLTATPVSPSQINLAWNASTDNVGVVGYHIYRNNVFLQDVTGTTFQNTGLTANTTYSYAISAFDAAGNGSTATAAVSATTLTPPPADTTPPMRSGGAPVGVLPAGTTQITMTLVTNEAATCKYGSIANTSYAALPMTFAVTGGTTHSSNLAGLSNGTSYTRYVRCIDAAGNANTNDFNIAFSVASPVTPADTTPPSVTMTAPASGTTVSGTTVTVSANASDNVGVVGVQFMLDGVNLGTEDTISPYAITWNTTGVSNGMHGMTARARDAAGNQTVSSGVSIVVNNVTADTQPPSTPTGLTATPVSPSQINLTWNASTDNVGVVGYHIYRNNVEIATTTLTSFNNTGLTANTAYSYAIAAFDAAGNGSTATATVSATTLTPPDTVAPASPILTLTSVTQTEAHFTIRAPGDDGMTGAASAYNLRYYTSPITETNWSLALPAAGEPAPAIATTIQPYTLTPLLPQTTYYVALKAIDESLNISALSNVVALTTQALSGTTPPTIPPSTPPTGGGGGGVVVVPPAGGGGGGGAPTPISPAPTYVMNPPSSSVLPPVLIRDLSQYRADGISIPEGAFLSTPGLSFKAFVFDEAQARTRIEVEIKKTHEGFTGTPTVRGEYSVAGTSTSVRAPALPAGAYKFRARAATQAGRLSPWLEFGTANIADFTVLPSAEDTGGSVQFVSTLRIGSRGPEVMALQERLIRDGFLRGGTDGKFGPMTRAAVIAFQRAHGLAPYPGITGPATRAKLNELAGSTGATPALAPPATTVFSRFLTGGSRGEDVRRLQQFLTEQGLYQGLVGGYYGTATRDAVKEFQKKYGIAPVGYVGPATRAKLNALVK